MAAFATQLGKVADGMAAFQVQDFNSQTASMEIPICFMSRCLSHLHILTSVDETFDHFDVTDKLEEFMVSRDAFTVRLMQTIWKWRGQDIVKKSEDEEWLKNVLEED